MLFVVVVVVIGSSLNSFAIETKKNERKIARDSKSVRCAHNTQQPLLTPVIFADKNYFFLLSCRVVCVLMYLVVLWLAGGCDST